jgi:hypothetical protein
MVECRILIIRSSKDTPEAFRPVCGNLIITDSSLTLRGRDGKLPLDISSRPRCADSNIVDPILSKLQTAGTAMG